MTYHEVQAIKNGLNGSSMTANDWDGYFGFAVAPEPPDPAKQTWTYKAISFIIDEEKLAAPGGLGSTVLITAQIVTEIGGIVDPTGICDGLNAAVLVAQGDKAGAAIALASIAVPFGVEKLAKAARRIPVGSLDELAGAVKQSADAVVKKVDDVAEESTELAAKAGANKAKALTKGPGECGVPGNNCFRTGTLTLRRRRHDGNVTESESSSDVIVALGAFGVLLALTAKPKSTKSASTPRRQRRRPFELLEPPPV